MDNIRLFIAVTATACSEQSRERRHGIRRTWMRDAEEMGVDIEVRFFIGQPGASLRSALSDLTLFCVIQRDAIER